MDKEIILWHDVLNNSLSKHRTNANTLYPLDDLITYLQSKRHRFKAIIYCRRTRTTDIFDSLMRTGILIEPKNEIDLERQEAGSRFGETIPGSSSIERT